MVSHINSVGLTGLEGCLIECECDLSGGLPNFEIVGLPDASVKEARDRVRTAVKNSGYEFPRRRITVNLAPADMRKEGPVYDLPILLSVLEASGQLEIRDTDCCFAGELSLNGELRPVRGALPMAVAAKAAGMKKMFLPKDNASEAALADGMEIYGAETLGELLAHLNGENLLSPAEELAAWEHTGISLDFADVRGQENARRAVEVAAAGGHNILLIGPPGAGKSMIAGRIPSILPELTRTEALECTQIHSIAGFTNRERPIVTERPFRAPHHTISTAGLSGGGRIPRPGEISLAHNGVLFLDELPEFRADALEILRQPLEEGRITISRVAGNCSYPSKFMMVCAMNPCKCGWYGHPSGKCKCGEQAVKAYVGKISGPLLDRIDMHVYVPAVKYDELNSRETPESSSVIKERVEAARAKAYSRGFLCNADMKAKDIRTICALDSDGGRLLKSAFEKLGMTARSHDRILKVARTIADLDDSENITAIHIAEAIQYRNLDRK